MHCKVLIAFIAALVAIQAVNANTIEIVIAKLREAEHVMETIRNRHFAVLHQFPEQFEGNFVSIDHHGQVGAEYVLRNLHYEVINLEYQANETGVDISDCVAKIRAVIAVLTFEVNKSCNKLHDSVLHDYEAMYVDFHQEAYKIDIGIEDLHKEKDYCSSAGKNEEDCFVLVLDRATKLEEYVRNEYQSRMIKEITAFFLEMSSTYQKVLAVYDAMHVDVDVREEEFLECFVAAMV